MANTAVVYDRKYDDKVLQFETSGGLLNASLVMRDAQTDSWWSIMTGDAIDGSMKGQKLKELPSIGEKTTWGAWRQKHPNSRVLSVDGIEHDDSNPYNNYFTSDQTFRGMKIDDDRMKPKQSIFSFQYDGTAYAVAFDEFEDGGLFEFHGDNNHSAQIFVYRPQGVSIFQSSVAYRVPRDLVEYHRGSWRFQGEKEWQFLSDEASLQTLAIQKDVLQLSGFDTFWYNWVAVHTNTVVLE